jgi:hypothetical protein
MLIGSKQASIHDMTVGICVKDCENSNHTWAGIYDAKDCYCGKTLQWNALRNRTASDCTKCCKSDNDLNEPGLACGDDKALMIP